MSVILILTNCPDETSALALGTALVEERLAASFNLGAGIESAYRWNGKVARGPERPLLLKTRADLFDRVAGRIREIHPYETPAITGWIPDRVSDDYAAWIAAETASG